MMPRKPPTPSSPRARAWLVLALSATLPACGGPEAPKARGPEFAAVELRVAAVGDPAALEPVRAQSGEWLEQNGVALVVHPEAVTPAEAAEYDVVLYPGDRLGALVDAGALAVIPEASVRPVGVLPLGPDAKAKPDEDDLDAPRRDPLDFSDVALPLREQGGKYGEDRMGLPLGSSALVLVYRRDALGSEASRAAARDAGVSLDPPRTWEELDALARFFQGRDWDGDGTPDHGLAVALGPDDPERVGLTAYLARAAALGQAPDQYALLFDADGPDLAPRIETPPFVESLAACAAWKDLGPPEMTSFDADAARAAFRDGRAALLIDRAERASTWTDPKRPAAVGVAALPGSPRVFDPMRQIWLTPNQPNRPAYMPTGGGWFLGLGSAAEGRTRAAAIAFLQAIASPETAAAIVSDPAFPMLPVRSSHLTLGLPDPRSALGVDSRAWGKAVADTYSAPRMVIGLRIPEADGYLADLDAARVSATRGDDPAAALARAAEAWTARTARLGPPQQRWHYRRSLNRLSTESQPPRRAAP